MANVSDRFVVVYSQGGALLPKTLILVDRATGVNYLFHHDFGHAGGLTVLLDKDGKPVITRLAKFRSSLLITKKCGGTMFPPHLHVQALRFFRLTAVL